MTVHSLNRIRSAVTLVGEPMPVASDALDRIERDFGFRFPVDARWIFETWGAGTFGDGPGNVVVSPWDGFIADRTCADGLMMQASLERNGFPLVRPDHDGIYPWGSNDEVHLAWRIAGGEVIGGAAFLADAVDSMQTSSLGMTEVLEYATRGALGGDYYELILQDCELTFRATPFDAPPPGPGAAAVTLGIDAGGPAEVSAAYFGNLGDDGSFAPGQRVWIEAGPDDRDLILVVAYQPDDEATVRDRTRAYPAAHGWRLRWVKHWDRHPPWPADWTID
jgi:hypothetical protein